MMNQEAEYIEIIYQEMQDCLEPKSVEEIAELLKIDRQTVYQRLRSAFKKMRKRLEPFRY